MTCTRVKFFLFVCFVFILCLDSVSQSLSTVVPVAESLANISDEEK